MQSTTMQHTAQHLHLVSKEDIAVKEYMKPELQVREIRVTENLASNAPSWSINDDKIYVTNYLGISALLEGNSPVA